MVSELTSAEQFMEQVMNPSLTVVDVYGSYCGPCRTLAPHLDKVAAQYPHVGVFKLNVTLDEDLVEKLMITCVPTVLFFWAGEEQTRFSGANTEKLYSMVETLQNGPLTYNASKTQ